MINNFDTVDYNNAVYQVVEKEWVDYRYLYTIVPYKRLRKDYRVVTDKMITYLPVLHI